MTVTATSIRDIASTAVLKISLQDTWCAVPRSGQDGTFWLDIRRPRSHHALYLQTFFGIVVANMPGIRTLHLRVPDLRTINTPGQQERYFHLMLGYDFMQHANVYTVPEGMAPETCVTSLQGDKVFKGSAPKFNSVLHFTCAPVSLT